MVNKKLLTIFIPLTIAGFFIVSLLSNNLVVEKVSATSHCVNRPTGSPPNELGTVQAVANEFPQFLQNSCQSEGGTWQFMDEVVSRLRTKDNRFAYNCKRGNCSDPSNDAISYYYGPAPVPPSGIRAYEVFVIDIISGHCGGSPSPAWGNVTQPGGALGGYVYPRTAGGSLPSANWCSGGPPPPPPPPPGTKYSCNQNNQCVIDQNGTYTNSNCNNVCAPAPPPPPPPPSPVLKPPQILGATPNVVRPSQTLSIIGVDLAENVRIESAAGQFNAELTATLNAPKTNAQITLPNNIPAGSYFVTVTNQAGSDTKANLFIVEEPPVVLPGIPPAKDFGDLIENIFTWALWLVGAAIFVNFLWAGLLWFTAAGRPGPISQAKDKMFNALIGAIILLASYLILNTINPDLVKQTFILPGL